MDYASVIMLLMMHAAWDGEHGCSTSIDLKIRSYRFWHGREIEVTTWSMLNNDLTQQEAENRAWGILCDRDKVIRVIIFRRYHLRWRPRFGSELVYTKMRRLELDVLEYR